MGFVLFCFRVPQTLTLNCGICLVISIRFINNIKNAILKSGKLSEIQHFKFLTFFFFFNLCYWIDESILTNFFLKIYFGIKLSKYYLYIVDKCEISRQERGTSGSEDTGP